MIENSNLQQNIYTRSVPPSPDNFYFSSEQDNLFQGTSEKGQLTPSLSVLDLSAFHFIYVMAFLSNKLAAHGVKHRTIA